MIGIESRYPEKLAPEQFNSSKMWREKLRVKERENKRKRLMEVSSSKIFQLRNSLYLAMLKRRKALHKIVLVLFTEKGQCFQGYNTGGR